MGSDVYPAYSLHKLVLNLLAEIQQVDKNNPLFNVQRFRARVSIGVM